MFTRVCPLCKQRNKELRYINPHDCGGCETCDGFFGGVYVCVNPECENHKELSELDPKREGWLQ